MTAAVVLVDDHLLLRLLLGDDPVELGLDRANVHTTGLWYHRLSRATAGTSVVGAMSRSLGDADPEVAARAVRAVIELPDAIGLVSLRTLAWPMAQLLESGAHLNLLSLEALAAALHLDAAIHLSSQDRNEPLIETAARWRVPVAIAG